MKTYVKIWKDLDIYPGTNIALSLKHPWHVAKVVETEHGISRSTRYFATKAQATAYGKELERTL